MTRPKHRAPRRGVFLAPVLLIAFALGQAGVLGAQAAPPADSPGPPSADGVQPVIADTQSSNDDCGQLGFDHGISIAGNGQVSSGALTVTVTGYNSPTGFADWSSNLPIHGVYAKGGPSGGNLFSYPAGDTGDQDLHTPQKSDGGYYGLSHLAFCWNDVATAPDVSITKANEPTGAVLNGDSITYTLTVTNDGTATATGVEVTDQLPAGVTFVSADRGMQRGGGSRHLCSGRDRRRRFPRDRHHCHGRRGVLRSDRERGARLGVERDGRSDGEQRLQRRQQLRRMPRAEPPRSPGDEELRRRRDSSRRRCLPIHDHRDERRRRGSHGRGARRRAAIRGAERRGPTVPHVRRRGLHRHELRPPRGLPTRPSSAVRSTSGPAESASVTIKVIVTGEVCGSITNSWTSRNSNEPAENVGPDNHAEATDEVACVPRSAWSRAGPHARMSATPSPTSSRPPIPEAWTCRTSTCSRSEVRLGTDALRRRQRRRLLAVNEHWTFRCDHTITAGDGDPVHNVGTVTGDHEGGTVSDTDSHDVDVIHPDIDLEKTASPTSGPAGTPSSTRTP